MFDFYNIKDKYSDLIQIVGSNYYRGTIICIVILCTITKLNKALSQNLVPNPSFELLNTCIVGSSNDALDALDFWFAPDNSANSPDNYNDCFGIPAYTPQSLFYTLSTARTGLGMVAVATGDEGPQKEIISVKLNQQLIQDSIYCVSFFVKNSNLDSVESWSKRLGIYLSNDTVHLINVTNINTAIHSTVTLDGEDWIEISDYYTAQGNEFFLTIGFFGTNDYYHPFNPPFNFIYYFIDDVSVYPCKKDFFLVLPNVITFNGDNINDIYILRHHNLVTLEIQIFNRWGNLVNEYDGLSTIWDGTDSKGNKLNDGVYYVKARGVSIFNDEIIKQQFVTLIGN